MSLPSSTTRSARLAFFLIKYAVLIFALVAGVAGNALAAGTISGHVTDSVTTLPLPNTPIVFYDSSADVILGTPATTDASGNYTATLRAGTYAVLTQAKNGYINKLYDNISCSAVCDTSSIGLVVVTDGGAVTGIDFALVPGGGRVSGTVTSSAGGAPIGGVRVTLLAAPDGVPFASGVTDGSGHYIIDGGSVTGTVYAVTANTAGYQNEAYNNVHCDNNCDVFGLGTAIPITLGATTANIDFALDPGGVISGTVRDTAGNPLADVEVRISDASGNDVSTVQTAPDGSYVSGGLPAASYYVHTRQRFGYADMAFNNIPCFGGNCNPNGIGGTAIPVTVGANASGKDFALPSGGLITGTVTAIGGAPLSNVFVGIFATNGNFLGGISTNDSGQYHITVAQGTYNVAVIGVAGYGSQIYSGISCPATPFCVTTGGTQVIVAAGGTASNINFALVAGTTGGIRGTVTNAAGGAAIPNVQVQVLSTSNVVVGNVTTDASGQYSFAGLAPGPYYVRTNFNTNFINQVSPNVVCVNCNVTTTPGATPVIVPGGGSATANFALSQGGRITGTITNAAGGGLLQGINAQVFSSTGVQMGSANTNASGLYASPALPPGDYFVRTAVTPTQNFLDQVYNNMPCVPCPVTSGNPVTIVGAANTGFISFALAGGGTISGTVTGAGGAPVPAMPVSVFDINGVVLKTITTDTSGNYSVAGLPTGNYIVRANPNASFQNYVSQVYNGLTANGLPNVLTPVDVVAGSTHSGVNFALSAGGSISGTVTGDGGAPLGSVGIAAYSATTGRTVKNGATDAFGLFTITGLEAGTYYVATNAPVIQTPFYLDEIYDNISCLGCIGGAFPAVILPSGVPNLTATPVVVTNGATHTDVNFSLASGAGVVTGVVSDAGGIRLTNVTVAIFNSSGVLVKSTGSAANSGIYTLRGLAPGTYYARTIVSPATPYYQDIAYGGAACAPCDVTATSTAIVVTANNATVADFVLPAGGNISGMVTDAATTNPLALANVQLYNNSGTLVKTTFTSSVGTFTLDGLPAGTYFARTAVTGALTAYNDQLFNGISCAVSCTVTSGTAINVVNGATQGGVNFALTPKPTIAPISNVVIRMNTAVDVPVTVGSTAGPAGVILNALSSNTTLVPNTNFGASGSGANRTLTITPAANQLGTTTVTVFASDSTGISNRQFAFSVVPTRGDGNGDNNSDILWRHTSGAATSWLMNGTQIIGGGQIAAVDPAWQIVGTGDYNGDRHADILWRHTSGAVTMWLMDGTTIIGGGGVAVVDVAWQIVGTGDYNGDGHADILWRHSSGATTIWLMNGIQIIGGGQIAVVDPAWQIVGTGDYNADGHADILWSHPSGTLTVWLMDGVSVIGGGEIATVDPAYQVVGTGDFNGDGRSDIVWRHSSGLVIIWEMDGLSIIGSGAVLTVDPAWQIVGTGDYNGDGRSDLLWRHTGGNAVIWLMNGTTIAGGGEFAIVDPAWQIINLR